MRRSQDRQQARAEAAIVKLQLEQEAKAPRFDPPVCWLCDRRLVPSKGRIIVAEDGRAHPAHAGCAQSYSPPITAQPADRDAPEESRP